MSLLQNSLALPKLEGIHAHVALRGLEGATSCHNYQNPVINCFLEGLKEDLVWGARIVRAEEKVRVVHKNSCSEDEDHACDA